MVEKIIKPTTNEYFKACLILSFYGDYTATTMIREHREGVQAINLANRIKNNESATNNLSYNSFLNLFTAEQLILDENNNFHDTVTSIAQKYQPILQNFQMYQSSQHALESGALQFNINNWDRVPYKHIDDTNQNNLFYFASSMSIGLRYAGEKNRYELVKYAIECGTLIHHHINNLMHSLICALFTAFAIEKVPVQKWNEELLNVLENECFLYFERNELDKSEAVITMIEEDFHSYLNKFRNYLEKVKLMKSMPPSNNQLKNNYSQQFDLSLEFGDNAIVAYNILLECIENYGEKQLEWKHIENYISILFKQQTICSFSLISTCCILGAWFGALSGFSRFSSSERNKIKKVDFYHHLNQVGTELNNLNQKF